MTPLPAPPRSSPHACTLVPLKHRPPLHLDMPIPSFQRPTPLHDWTCIASSEPLLTSACILTLYFHFLRAIIGNNTNTDVPSSSPVPAPILYFLATLSLTQFQKRLIPYLLLDHPRPTVQCSPTTACTIAPSVHHSLAIAGTYTLPTAPPPALYPVPIPNSRAPHQFQPPRIHTPPRRRVQYPCHPSPSISDC